MNFLFPFIAIAGDAIAKTIDKLNFARNRISSHQLMSVIFLTMFCSLLLFIIITKQPFPNFSLVSFGLVVLIALVSFGGNVFDILSLKEDDLSLREPMLDFEPMLAGMVGYILFPDERKVGFLAAFILGILIAYWGSHQRKLRNLEKKGMSYFLLAVMLYALLPSLYKVTLEYITPEYIALFRVTTILVLAAFFFPAGNLHAFSKNKVAYGISSGIAYAITTVAGLYAISALGVVLTMLLLLLGPSLRYLSGYFVLKEKVRRGEITSSLLLAAVVLVTVFM